MDKPKKVKKDNKVKSINKHKSNHGPASSLSFTSQDLFSTPTILLSPFSSLLSITSLNLSSNLFSYIPDEISQLCNIEVLNVADNYIRYISSSIFYSLYVNSLHSSHPFLLPHSHMLYQFYTPMDSKAYKTEGIILGKQ